ncbi:MAG: FCD domain-containing protein [Marivibrio sp.]|uniref:FadR/GntR family transcriptional regulator n=1 Tax=Marivibrio sp. TaxID=2039719 RepID=UPI0032EFA7EF
MTADDAARAALGERPRKAGEEGMSLRKLAVAPTYRVVAETIEREIMEGRLKPGDRLPSETALADQLGVNRSTAREGLRLLEQTGLVERKSGRRLHAAVPGHQELSSRASRALLLQQVTFIDLHQLLMVLEPSAAALAARAIEETDLRHLEDNVERTEEAVARGESVTQLDLEFHDIIGAAVGNPAWLMAREPAANLMFPAADPMMNALPQAPKRLVDAHREILNGLKRRDADHAELWMRKHIVDFKRGYELAKLEMDQPVRAAGLWSKDQDQ